MSEIDPALSVKRFAELKAAGKSTAEAYYELVWGLRLELFKSIIASGETHPLRVLGKFLHHQRFHDAGFSEAEGIHFKRMHEARLQNVNAQNGQFNFDQSVLPTGIPQIRVIPLMDRYVEAPAYNDCNTSDFILDLAMAIEEKRGKIDAVIELGSGYGYNLFNLYYHGGPRVPCYACEFTQSGAACTRLLASLDPGFQITAHAFDYKNPDLSFVKKYDHVFVFTRHSIEQVERVPDHLLKTITGVARRVTCLHIEPFGYQIGFAPEPTHTVHTDHKNYFTSKNWNANLYDVLCKSAAQGWITLDYLGYNILGGVPGNPSSLALWHHDG